MMNPFKSAAVLLGALLAIGAVIIAGTIFHTRQVANGATEAVQQARPSFQYPDVRHRLRRADEWNGKVLVVNFWATWCPPCLREIPSFNALQAKYGARGVQFVGIAVDDREAVEHFLRTTAIKYPVLIGEDAAFETSAQYGNVAAVLPYTAIVDRKGKIAFTQPGLLSEELAAKVIESLL